MAISQKEHTPVEFFAEGYRLSGSFDARRASLGDALYDATSEFIILHEAYISVIDRPAEILTNYPMALVTKWSVAFALTSEQELALRHDQKFSPYQRPKTRHLHLIVPFFELTGDLRMPGHVDPRLMFKTQKESFVTLLDVTARSTSDSSVSYQGGAALVNTSKISFVGMKSL